MAATDIMVSVIIPAYNAARTISRCLEFLMEQDCAEDYEVIVIDDGSTDSTPQTVSKFNNVRLIRQNNAGPAAARNRGAAEAKGGIILFTDADCFPEHNWISEMLKPFNENPDLVGVKGSYKSRQEEIIARFVQLEYEDKYERMMKERYIDFIDTYSAGFRKKIFLDMNGYDTDFPVACAEDVELSFRMANHGYKMVFNPKAVVYHIHPDTLSAYLRKKYKFAFWRIVALKKNPNKALKDSHTPHLMKIQLLFPPLIFIALLYSGFSETGVTVTLLLLSFFIFTAFPFILNAIKKDALLALLTPSLLFLRSAAQCAGVAVGIVYSLTRRKLQH